MMFFGGKFIKIFLSQFKDLLFLILLGFALVSWFLGKYLDAAAIMSIIILKIIYISVITGLTGVGKVLLLRKLDQLRKVLMVLYLVLCLFIVITGIVKGGEVYQFFLTGVSLAVVGIPKELTAAANKALMVGIQRMIKRQIIIRDFEVLDVLNWVNVICLNKTGVLTGNKIMVSKAIVGGVQVDFTGQGYDPKGKVNFAGEHKLPELPLFMKVATLCNNASLLRGEIKIGGFFRGKGKNEQEWGISGDPTEGALLVMAAKAGYWREQIEQKEKRETEIPFNPDRKRMTVVYNLPAGRKMVYIKGAPEVILERCTYYYRNGRLLPLNETIKEEILSQNSLLAGQALRVLALAYRELIDKDIEYREEKIEQGLTFLGLAGLSEPLKPDTIAAVRSCFQAGIRVVMITGDHQLTAQAIAREAGLLSPEGKVLTGAQIDEMDEEELRKEVKIITVYARVSSRHKLRIVKTLKETGEVVAVTGFEVTDVPAIEKADLGIAIGKQSNEAIKEASSLVLLEDGFGTIVRAVEEGRGICENIKRFASYLLSTGFGVILTVLMALLAGLPLPLSPLQILWIGMVIGGLSVLVLTFYSCNQDIMRRQFGKPGKGIFTFSFYQTVIWNGILFSAGTLLVFISYLQFNHNLDIALTMAFNTLFFTFLFFILAMKSWLSVGTLNLTPLPKISFLLIAMLLVSLLQLLINWLPLLRIVFQVVPLTGTQWMIILIVAAIPVIFHVIIRFFQNWVREKFFYGYRNK